MIETAEPKKGNQALNIFVGDIKTLNTASTKRKGAAKPLPSLRRQQSTSGRLISLCALSFLFGKPTDYWVFDKDSRLPKLSNHPNIHISTSHSGPFVGCAISSYSCGFDLQVHVEKDILGIAETFFCKPEYQMLHQLEQKEREEQFFRLWTLKEAWSKLPGETFLETLGNVSFLPKEPLREGYSAWCINLQENLSSAVIVRGRLDDLVLWQHNGDAFAERHIEQKTIEKLA